MDKSIKMTMAVFAFVLACLLFAPPILQKSYGVEQAISKALDAHLGF